MTTPSAYCPQYAAERHTQHLNGLSHEVLHWPRNSRPKLLLLHGWMDCADTFQALVDTLPPQYDIYAFSWRGFGGSQWQHSAYYERMVMLQDLHQFLDHISPNDAIHVCGHSMGSMLATHFACLFPERIKSLTMAEGFGMPVLDQADELRARARRFVHTPEPNPAYTLKSITDVAEKLCKRNPQMSLALAQHMAQALTQYTEQGLVYRADPKHHLPQAHPYDWHRIAPLWTHLHMPTLWLQGENLPHNHYLQRVESLLAERQALLPNLQKIVSLKGSGHMLQWEAPQAFADALDKFLRQVEAKSVQ